MRSLAVVMKGPEANAGLIPNLSNIKGVKVPIKEAKRTTEKRAIATTKANLTLISKGRQ